MADRAVQQPNSRSGWRRRAPWLIGAPVLAILAIAGIFVWGSLQPRPEGYAVASTDPAAGPAVLEPAPTTIPEKPEEIIRHTLDAASTEEWVLFDFAVGETVVGDLSSLEWDIAFRRTKLLTNSGVTNPEGRGGALDLGEVPLEEAEAPAAATFIVDSFGGEDGDEAENAAAGRWYKYSFITHIVSVKPDTYLFRTGDEQDALVQFDSYYCEDEEPGCITFRYKLVPRVAES